MTDPDAEPQGVEILFSTSFESDRDTIGFRGFGFFDFVNDCPKAGGFRSLAVYGSDFAPHASLTLAALEDSQEVVLSFWARNVQGNLQNYSDVRLIEVLNQQNHGIWLSVSDTVWRNYSDTLDFPPGQPLRLWITSGGVNPGGMHLDLIKVASLPRH
jgi:hypothetical protein